MVFTYEGSSSGNPQFWKRKTVQLFKPVTGTWAVTNANAPVTRLGPSGGDPKRRQRARVRRECSHQCGRLQSGHRTMVFRESNKTNPHWGGTITLLPNGEALAVAGDDINNCSPLRPRYLQSDDAKLDF